LAFVDAAGRQIEHDALLITHLDLSAIQNEKRLHGGMSDALVAVDERMVLDKREAERCTEGRLGLGDCRFECAKISNPRGVTRCFEKSPVQPSWAYSTVCGCLVHQPASPRPRGATRG